jgi:small conductance mechanosensitive channel
MNDFMNGDWLDLYVIPWATNIALALVIFFVGKWVARIATNVARRLMRKAEMDEMLAKFLANITYGVLLVAVALAALDNLGLNITSLIAVLGAAGLAVGLALKDSLSNFAAGVMLVIFRPFKVGDYINAGGSAGTVDEIALFKTLLRTPDNQRVIVPNSAIFGGIITNVNTLGTRRVDLVFGIGYDDDMKKTKELLEQIIADDERILKEPAASVSLAELADSSVNFNVRPWCNASDYWGLRSDLLTRVKEAFDANGISIPYPQQDVHYHQAGEAA